ncbi:hypothetical protein [uncultured Dokdonia sp.]|uniref:hypothetical protein n=1 Tax=uncultured Dokdonia sp. TaxID=575653 RepID=UPI00262BF6D4|nr:hypothetical protein [uncultured Dokdonia sp.]
MSNIIKLSDAENWTLKWQNETKGQNHCNAFLVPVQDLLGALSEMGILSIDGTGNIKGHYTDTQEEKIRTYMAIDETIITTIDKTYPPGETRDEALKDAGWGEKLLVVGTVKTTTVNKSGNIIYEDIVKDEKNGSGGTARYPSGVTLNGSGVYDFTAPCPNDCDPNSPLNH